ncbi:MAG: hypothetical protein IPN76_15900 [Saprospiraceae bacterium]|nr:hypothetical protein [Saprospiraceae bacterium]
MTSVAAFIFINPSTAGLCHGVANLPHIAYIQSKDEFPTGMTKGKQRSLYNCLVGATFVMAQPSVHVVLGDGKAPKGRNTPALGNARC